MITTVIQETTLNQRGLVHSFMSSFLLISKTMKISTKGSSPAVSRFIREQLELHYPALDEMVILQREMRMQLKQYVSSPAKRNTILREILHDRAVWEALQENPEEVREQLRGRYLHD